MGDREKLRKNWTVRCKSCAQPRLTFDFFSGLDSRSDADSSTGKIIGAKKVPYQLLCQTVLPLHQSQLQQMMILI